MGRYKAMDGVSQKTSFILRTAPDNWPKTAGPIVHFDIFTKKSFYFAILACFLHANNG